MALPSLSAEWKPSEGRNSPSADTYRPLERIILRLRWDAPTHPHTLSEQEPLSLQVFTFPGNVFPHKSHRTNILLMLKVGANRDLERSLHLCSPRSTQVGG